MKIDFIYKFENLRDAAGGVDTSGASKAIIRKGGAPFVDGLIETI